MNLTRHFAAVFLALTATLLPATMLAQEVSMQELNAGMAGTEYYIAFPQNSPAGEARQKFMGVLISSQVATVGVVEVPGGNPIPFETRPGQVTPVSIARSLEFIKDQSEEVTNMGVHITSRAPVSVYVLNARFQSTGGYPAIPVTHWGTHYQALTLPNQIGDNVSQLVVVAAHDSTRITIRPNAQTYRASAGQEVTKWLVKKGETFSMLAFPGGSGTTDLSASEITSNRPVGVISGHVRSSVDLQNRVSHLDYATHQAAMLLPDASWGKEYLSVPMRPTGDRFRLMPSGGNTRIVMTHYPPGGGVETFEMNLGRGEYTDVATINGHAITGPVSWKSSETFMLMQLRTSGPYPDPTNSPVMIPLTAISQLSTRSTFSAVEEIEFAYFTHSLTLIARGPESIAPDDPSNPLRNLRIDGRPVYEIAPALLTQRIGNTPYYHVTFPIAAGAHSVISDPAYPFTGTIRGENGTVARDAYASVLPFWMPEASADLTAPHLQEKFGGTPKGIVSVLISDRSDGYFSGIEDVRVAPGFTGWVRSVNFQRPSPDNDATATFRAITDPSGPLVVELLDRDGNVATVTLDEGVCFKTAIADRASVEIHGNMGTGVVFEEVVLHTNPCGDPANITRLDLGTGNARQYIDVAFNGSTPSFVIPSRDSAVLRITAKNGTPAGSYITTISITANDSTIRIPITLVVGTSSVPLDPLAASLGDFYPNPFTGSTTLHLAQPLKASAVVTISDRLGRVVLTLAPDELAGRSQITWNGEDASGRALPAGLYLFNRRPAGSPERTSGNAHSLNRLSS